MAKPIGAKPFMVQPLPITTPAAALFVTPVSIIDPQYCEPYPVDLAIVRKVTNTNGNVIFKVKGALLSLCDHRVLINGAGNPVVTLRQKV